MMFIEDSVLDQSIKNIVTKSNGIQNTGKATGRFLEATKEHFNPFLRVKKEGVKTDKLDLRSPYKSHLLDLKGFHENIARVRSILENASKRTHKSAEAAGVGVVENCKNAPAANSANGLKESTIPKKESISKDHLIEFRRRITAKLAKDKQKKSPCEFKENESANVAEEVVKGQQDELEEEFTLIDVIDEEEDKEYIPLAKKPKLIRNDSLNSKEKRTRGGKKKKAAKKQKSSSNIPTKKSAKKTGKGVSKGKVSNHKQHKLKVAEKSRSKKGDCRTHIRPIETVSYTIEDLFGRRNKPRSKPRVLNGSLDLRNKKFCEGLSTSRTFDEYQRDCAYFNREVLPRRSINDFRTPRKNYFLKNQKNCRPACCHAEREDTERLLYKIGRNPQMGFDFLNRLRKFIYPRDENRTINGTRKRRPEDLPPDNSTPNLIKYRKVENSFPKIITQTFEDDMNPQRNRTVYQSSGNIFSTPLEMSRRRSIHDQERKFRNSLFAPPQQTQKILRGNTYADLEFSDDEEDFRNNTARVSFNGNSLIKSGGGFKKPMCRPQVIQIPIRRVGEKRNTVNMNSIPTSNMGSIIDLNTEPTVACRRPCYADVLKYGSSSLQEIYNKSTESCPRPNNSTVSTGKLKTNSWSNKNNRSILQHQKEIEEREKYNKLLQQVAPHLYAKENQNLSPSRPSSLIAASPKGRRSISTNTKPSITIDLDDDEDDDVSITNITKLPFSSTLNRSKNASKLIDLVKDDHSSTEVIDLDDDGSSSMSSIVNLDKPLNSRRKTQEAEKKHLPFVEPVNTLRDCFKSSPHLDAHWLDNMKTKWLSSRERRLRELQETSKVNEEITAERKAAEVKLQEKFKEFRIVDPELIVIDDFAEPEEEPDIISLTPAQEDRIKAAIYGSPDQILVSKFNMNITRRDIHTLLNQNWLNDEVINFYMNLLMERGDLKKQSHGYPTVYAMNTFFVPRLLQGGHSAVKRWTRKVDIFSKDIIPVPVHVGGVHWCMAIIHLKNRSIKYYDSMGTPNPTVLKALEKYLQDESLDKRKEPFDTKGFQIESVRDVPRQMNGSDCGVFSCMFAEYITRNREITFSQNEMIYFRNKMIYEIVQGELLR